MRAWVTNKVHQGKCDEISGQVQQADPGLCTVRTGTGLSGGARAGVNMTYLTLSKQPPLVPPSFPSIRPILSPLINANSLSPYTRARQLANTAVITSVTNKPPLHSKGTAVLVMKGAYKGSEGVVQGKACAGSTVLEGQCRVLLKSPKEMNIFLPVDYLQVLKSTPPVFVPTSYSTALSPANTSHCPEEKAGLEVCTNLSTGTSTGTNTNTGRQDLTAWTSHDMSLLSISCAILTDCSVEQATMGLQCAIFVDTGDLKSLFALFC